MLQLCFLIQLNFSICPLSPRRAYLCSAYVQARKKKHLLGLEEHPALALNTCFGC